MLTEILCSLINLTIVFPLSFLPIIKWPNYGFAYYNSYFGLANEYPDPVNLCSLFQLVRSNDGLLPQKYLLLYITCINCPTLSKVFSLIILSCTLNPFSGVYKIIFLEVPSLVRPPKITANCSDL